jgi:hypothetical protein
MAALPSLKFGMAFYAELAGNTQNASGESESDDRDK